MAEIAIGSGNVQLGADEQVDRLSAVSRLPDGAHIRFAVDGVLQASAQQKAVVHYEYRDRRRIWTWMCAAQGCSRNQKNMGENVSKKSWKF